MSGALTAPTPAPTPTPALALAPAPARRGGLGRVRRWLAVLVLPAAIVPVPLLGPALLRSPHRLYRQSTAAIERLARPAGRAPHRTSRISSRAGRRGRG